MYPTIHNNTAETLKTQGYGALSDCISCEVTEELNGGFTLEMKYPIKGTHAEYLVPGNVIMARPNHNQQPQPFRINQVKRSFSQSIMVYANHISYDLSGYPVPPSVSFNSLAAAIQGMNEASWSYGSAAFHQFTFDTDMTSEKTISLPSIQTMRSWMGGQEGSIIDVYGGEWEYDTFTCFLKNRRGRDTGIRISYGKNLAEYTKDQEYTKYSHVCAFWKKTDDTAYSDLKATNIDCSFRVAYVDASDSFEEKPSTAQLNTFAAAEAEKMDMNTQTVTVTPAQIGNDVIGLGDGVLICYETVFSTRVIKTVWDVLAGRYKTLELGSKKTGIADTIKTLSPEKGGMNIKTKTVSGTPNSYGCINTGLSMDCIVLCAKAPTNDYDNNSAMITPFVAGGTWWIRATKWQDGWSAVTSSMSVTVYYI